MEVIGNDKPEPITNDWEAIALQTLKTLVGRERSPQRASDISRTLQKKRPEYDHDTLNGYVANALRNLAKRGLVTRNEQYKTYWVDHL